MFLYERNLIKRAFSAAKSAVKRAITEVEDPAVRRAVVLGVAAYMIRRLPFLDQPTAEAFSTKALLLAGLVLSKMPGTSELAHGAAPAAEPVQETPVPPPAPSAAVEPIPEVSA